MNAKNILKKYKGVIVLGIAILIGVIILNGAQYTPPTEPSTDPEDIITLGTFNKNVTIGDRIYIQGTQIRFPTDEKYSFTLTNPSGQTSSWGYKSTTTNPSSIVPFNFYVEELGEHVFTMTKTSDGSFIASEKFTLTSS